ncbi:unnamed protein product (macronuclear) [Paramecium tetraurelia]|uniref:Uncharacterized protein n=1 Tax=Paramecium tetraurelia TaxID=5888 RepID=A0CFS0_PARTE|nr:uncharacterized protein GSPATT00038078001 [Paramecium tetraurelia]CAK69637.1 unnamed protein product [Paramecium tetraurelia]|eukprot:XP_001437034.1 hypothetical protein (macronuclear) [Paramecium tetraurelia strain d4-2]
MLFDPKQENLPYTFALIKPRYNSQTKCGVGGCKQN